MSAGHDAPHGPHGSPGSHGPPEGERAHIWDKPENVRRFLIGFWIVCALLFVADFFVHRHEEHVLEGFRTIYAIYGFVGIALLIVIAKQLRKVVMRSEDYYDAD